MTEMTVRYTDGSSERMVSRSTTLGLKALLRRDQCALWDSRYAPNGSFSMIGGRGVTNWIELGKHEIDFIRSIPENDDLWNWAASGSGDIYMGRDDTVPLVRWPVILLSSTYEDIQHVRVLTVNGMYSLVDSIAYQASGDYSEFTPERHPEYWLWAYTDYKGGGYGPSHQMSDGRYLTFRMPLFNSITFPKISADAKTIGGFWVDSRVFA